MMGKKAGLSFAADSRRAKTRLEGKQRLFMKKRIVLILLALCLLPGAFAMGEEEAAASGPASARDALIDGIIETGRQLYVRANGKLQRAHYAGDIYICKNFTVYVFRENSASFRMAAYPSAVLSVPSNLPAAECKPYCYGYCWEDVKPEDGNPFYVAAQFVYDASLSKAENMERALAFMQNVRRGDYFQMSADYYYGIGAHSAIMISDYDAHENTVHWMDSNMAGEKRDGIRYGKVQFDRVKDISWWAEAFCKKGRGATLYRLRDDIVYYDGEPNGAEE